MARVRLTSRRFDRLSTLGLTEVLHYGAEAPQVTRALLSVVAEPPTPRPTRVARPT